jgi:hypothetical protein
MQIKKAELMSFNATDYTAVVRLYSGYTAYLEDVAVARNIPSGGMATGRPLAVVFFDENNPKEAVVAAVYT